MKGHVYGIGRHRNGCKARVFVFKQGFLGSKASICLGTSTGSEEVSKFAGRVHVLQIVVMAIQIQVHFVLFKHMTKLRDQL